MTRDLSQGRLHRLARNGPGTYRKNSGSLVCIREHRGCGYRGPEQRHKATRLFPRAQKAIRLQFSARASQPLIVRAVSGAAPGGHNSCSPGPSPFPGLRRPEPSGPGSGRPAISGTPDVLLSIRCTRVHRKTCIVSSVAPDPGSCTARNSRRCGAAPEHFLSGLRGNAGLRLPPKETSCALALSARPRLISLRQQPLRAETNWPPPSQRYRTVPRPGAATTSPPS